MGLMDAGLVAEIQTSIGEIIEDRSASIVLIRDGTAQPAQTVRIERIPGKATKIDGRNSEETRGTIIVLGAVGLDIRKDDTFVDQGFKYKVRLVRHNQQVGVQAEADIAQ
ncbi:MAG: hypothetical protein GY943_16745 [Chloroflexi bacterium]|nr:hypothetical protein [Chloroflexota bacterium]